MTTLSAWWNERFTGAFVKWIQKAPDTVANLIEDVVLTIFETFAGWEWVAAAITSGIERWMSKQTPERLSLLVESGLEGWMAATEAAAALVEPDA